MANGLERFDEVLAAMNDEPSPYWLAEQEKERLKQQQLSDAMDEVFKAFQEIQDTYIMPQTLIVNPTVWADIQTYTVTTGTTINTEVNNEQ